jgi:HK97 family phage major capsid protein
MTAEGAIKAKVDFDLVLASAKVKKITAFIKISKEMLDDVDLIEAEINQELSEVINLKIDVQLLKGDDLGENLAGIEANATAFAAGAFSLLVVQPNKADVLRVAYNQIEVAQFQPNYIILHPSDVAAMELEKGTDGHYIMKPFSAIDGTSIKGVPVITNTGVTAGDFLVGDFTKSAVRFKEGLTFDMGYEKLCNHFS